MAAPRELRLMRHVAQHPPEADTPQFLAKFKTTKRELDLLRRQLENDEKGFTKQLAVFEKDYLDQKRQANLRASQRKDAKIEEVPEEDQGTLKATEVYDEILARFGVKWGQVQ